MSLFDECNTWLCETMWWDEESIRWPSCHIRFGSKIHG